MKELTLTKLVTVLITVALSGISLRAQTCSCNEYIYLNEIANAGRVHKYLVNDDGTIDEVNPRDNGANTGPWYPNGSASELSSPHGLGTDLNGYLYIASDFDGTGIIRRLDCDGNIRPTTEFQITNAGTFNITSVGNTLYANPSGNANVTSYSTCDGAALGEVCFNNIPFNPNNPWMERQGDWGLFYDERTGYFYSLFSQDHTEDATWIDRQTAIYRYRAEDFGTGNCIDPLVTSAPGAAFGALPTVGAHEIPLTNVSGLTTDNVGNIYYVATGYLEPGQIIKLDPDGNFLAASAIDNMDGDGGWWGARAIVYSETSGELYVSTQTVTITEDCIARFDTDLNYIDFAVFAAGTNGNSGSGKAMAIQYECCPDFTNLTYNQTSCPAMVGDLVNLAEYLPCDDICPGDWMPVSGTTTTGGNVGTFNDCDNTFTFQNQGTACFDYTYVPGTTGNEICGPFSIDVCITFTDLPSATTATMAGSCDASSMPNSDAQVNLTAIVDATKVGIVAVGTNLDYDQANGPDYNSAADLMGAMTYDFMGLMHNTDYFVRVFNGSDGCFMDYQVTTPAAPCSPDCDCKDFIYLNEISNGGVVHKLGVNDDGSVTEVFNSGNPWYPGVGTSILPRPHGLGVDLNGYLYIGDDFVNAPHIFRLDCAGDFQPNTQSLNNGFIDGDWDNNGSNDLSGLYNISSYDGNIYSTGSNVRIYKWDPCTGEGLGYVSLNGATPDDWGFYIDQRTGVFYSTSQSSQIYRFTPTDANFTNLDSFDPFLEPDPGGAAITIGATYTTTGSMQGITTDPSGNIYVIEGDRDVNGTPSRLVKYNAAGEVTAIGLVDNIGNDGQGWNQAVGIVYSNSSDRLYVSSLNANQWCLTSFDTDLVMGREEIGPVNSIDAAKAIGIITECCPTTTPLSYMETVCYDGTDVNYFLNNIFSCGDGVICEGQWSELTDANNVFDFDNCDLSITVSGDGCATYRLEKTSARSGAQQCDPFQIDVQICTAPPPSATPSTTEPTCNASNMPNDDAQINLTAIMDSDVVGISSAGATEYDGSDYSATAVAADLELVVANAADFMDLPSNTTYWVRVFNGSNNCFVDYEVMTPSVVCPNCSVNLELIPTNCVDNMDGTYTAEYQVVINWNGAPDPAELIDVQLDGSSIGMITTIAGSTGNDNSLTINIPADGDGSHTVTVAFVSTSSCSATATVDAPVPCPDDVGPCDPGNGCLGGNIFNDYDCNGVNDTEPGIRGVQVMVYDEENDLVGTTYSDRNGDWEFCTGIVADMSYRVEFSTLPNMSWAVPSHAGTTNGTNVQFSDPTVCLDFSLVDPNTCSAGNSQLLVGCYSIGNPVANTDAAIFYEPYTATTLTNDPGDPDDGQDPGSNVIMHDNVLATVAQVGSIYGFAIDEDGDQLFTSAFNKRGAGFGPGADNVADGSTGAIYQIDINSGAVSVLVDLDPSSSANPDPARYSTGSNVHPNTTTDWTCDWDSHRWVGKSSWGDIDISEDYTTLYAMNLFDRGLYEIDIATGMILGVYPVPGAITGISAGATTTAWPMTISTCSNDPDLDIRPMALKYYNDLVYVGLTCTGESTQSRNDLYQYVFTFDPTTGNYSTVPVESGPIVRNGQTWQNWPNQADYDLATTLVTDGDPGTNPDINQFRTNVPLLSDIEFIEGNMLLGIRNIGGDRNGNFLFNYDDCSGGFVPNAYFGELELACANLGGTWDHESTGNCGTGANYMPGSGTFNYYDQDFGTHTFSSGGALAILPGENEILQTAYPGSTEGHATVWSNTSYVWTRTLIIYDGVAQPTTFDKNGGLADIELFCPALPLEIGNYVWCDENENGIQDATEEGVDGINVQLFDSSGALVGVTTTANGGQYYFNQDNVDSTGVTPDGMALNGFTGMSYGTDYTIVFGEDQFSNGEFSTNMGTYEITPMNDVNTNMNDNVDSDVDPANLNGSGLPFIAVTTDAVGCASHDYDLGLLCGSVSLGSTVFEDANNNGIQDSGENGIANVLVVLYMDGGDDTNDGVDDTAIITGADGIVGTADDADGPDGINGTADDGQAGMLTSVMGDYFFGNLSAGDYYVQIPVSAFAAGAALEMIPLSSNTSSGTFAGETDPDSDNRDNDDEGLQPAGSSTVTTSQIISLESGSEPTDADTETAQGSAQDNPAAGYVDADGNMTLDFGFFAPVSLGDTTWVDTNANGLQDDGEPILENVGVTLFNADGSPVTVDAAGNAYTNTTSTNNQGFYEFTNLPPGDYYVVFDLSSTSGNDFFTFTTNTGGDEANDSDADPTTGQSDNSGFISSGGRVPDLDAGVVCNVEVEAGTGQTICSTATVDLTTLGASITPNNVTNFGGTWTTSGTGTFNGDDPDGDAMTGDFATATAYTPSAADILIGGVILTLTTDDPSQAPFNAMDCGSVSDEVMIIILKVDCGNYPWDGD